MTPLLRQWQTFFCYIGLTICLAGCQTEVERLNKQSPIVINAPVMNCHLSPSRRYVDTVIDTGTSFPEFRIYDLVTGQQVAEELLPPNRDSVGWIWLDGDIRFHATEYTPHRPGPRDRVPLNGWLVDIPNQRITDVLSLDPQDQSIIFDQVATAFRQEDREMGGDGSISPDGHFIANAHVIWEYLGPGRGRGTMVNSSTAANPGSCIFRWKADSSGVYFIDHDGGPRNATGGPIRFLPVVPIP